MFVQPFPAAISMRAFQPFPAAASAIQAFQPFLTYQACHQIHPVMMRNAIMGLHTVLGSIFFMVVFLFINKLMGVFEPFFGVSFRVLKFYLFLLVLVSSSLFMRSC
jgi:hypothetical protein